MATPTVDLGALINTVVNTLVTIFQTIINVIAENASAIATLIVVGGIAYLVYRYGRRYLSGLIEWFRGLF